MRAFARLVRLARSSRRVVNIVVLSRRAWGGGAAACGLLLAVGCFSEPMPSGRVPLPAMADIRAGLAELTEPRQADKVRCARPDCERAKDASPLAELHSWQSRLVRVESVFVKLQSSPTAGALRDLARALDVNVASGGELEIPLDTETKATLDELWQWSSIRAGRRCQALAQRVLRALPDREPWGLPLRRVLTSLKALESGEDQVGMALHELMGAIEELRLSLGRVNHPREKLQSLLAEPETQVLMAEFRASKLLTEPCFNTPEEVTKAYMMELGASGAGSVVQWEARPRITEALHRAEEALRAFLSLELIRAPAPADCELPSEPASYLWQSQELDAAEKALSSYRIPQLLALRDASRVREDELAVVYSAFPRATCNVVARQICGALRAARKPFDNSAGSRLRIRARAFGQALPAMGRLRGRIEQLGCDGEDFGLDDAETYARALLKEANEQVAEMVVSAASELETGSKGAQPLHQDEKAILKAMRRRRVEIGAIAFGIAEPALAHLASTSPLPEGAGWPEVIEDLQAVNGRSDAAGASGLYAFEHLVGLLQRRNGELCQFVGASWVDSVQKGKGVFFGATRDLVKALQTTCKSKPANAG